jgi:hypothetical protein
MNSILANSTSYDPQQQQQHELLQQDIAEACNDGRVEHDLRMFDICSLIVLGMALVSVLLRFRCHCYYNDCHCDLPYSIGRRGHTGEIHKKADRDARILAWMCFGGALVLNILLLFTTVLRPDCAASCNPEKKVCGDGNEVSLVLPIVTLVLLLLPAAFLLCVRLTRSTSSIVVVTTVH